MKKLFFYSFMAIMLMTSCTNYHGKTRYYKYKETGKVLNSNSYTKVKLALIENLKSLKGHPQLQEVFTDSIISGDSIIKTFEFNIHFASDTLSEKHASIYDYINQKLPANSLATLDGRIINLSQFEGKPTIINFWFTSCPDCIEQIHALNKLQKKYKDKVNFISITFNTRNQVAEFVKSHQYNFLKVVNALEFTNKLGIKKFPTTVLLDRNGFVKKVKKIEIQHRKYGNIAMGNEKELEKDINELL